MSRKNAITPTNFVTLLACRRECMNPAEFVPQAVSQLPAKNRRLSEQTDKLDVPDPESDAESTHAI